jgi:hypothetical protein
MCKIQLRSILLVIMMTVFMQSCEDPYFPSEDNLATLSDDLQTSGDPSARVAVGSAASTLNYQILYAGQNTNAGAVTYDDVDTNDDLTDDALQVTFQSSSGWEFTEIHFFVGTSFTGIPTNKSGNPQPGLFPYKSGSVAGQTTYTFTIPFSEIGFSCPSTTTEDFFVAAHAGMRKQLAAGGYQTESGWGDGLRLVQRGSWGMYNLIYITCDINSPPKAATTESAFAFDGDPSGCFQNFGEFIDNPARWGWTNGPYSPGNYKFPIYSGAGLCDITKGVLVGYLFVNYSGSSAVFNYQLNGTDPATGVPYSLREVHAYAGNDLFPKISNGAQQGDFTIAPGKYPVKAGSLNTQSYSVTVSGLSGDIYIIAHSVVHGFPQMQ